MTNVNRNTTFPLYRVLYVPPFPSTSPLVPLSWFCHPNKYIDYVFFQTYSTILLIYLCRSNDLCSNYMFPSNLKMYDRCLSTLYLKNLFKISHIALRYCCFGSYRFYKTYFLVHLFNEIIYSFDNFRSNHFLITMIVGPSIHLVSYHRSLSVYTPVLYKIFHRDVSYPTARFPFHQQSCLVRPWWLITPEPRSYSLGREYGIFL